MSNNIFEPMDPIRFGWNTLKDNLKFFVVLMVIVAALYNLPSLVQMLLLSAVTPSSDTTPIIIISAILALISAIFYLVIELGLLGISLDFRDGKPSQIKDLFKNYPLILKYLAALIIYGLMVSVGLILLIIPGIYLALRYQLYGYIIVDRGLGPIEALKESSRMTRGALTNLFVFWLTLYCGIFVIMLFLMIIIAIPIGIIAAAISPDLAAIFAIISSFIVSLINLLVILPITKLSTADIYRILEARLMASSAAPALAPAEGA